MQIGPFGLIGTVVRLEPMALDHVDGLVAAASVDRSTFGFTMVPSTSSGMQAHVESLLALRSNGVDLPFTTCSAVDGRVLGMTRFLWLRSYYGREMPDAVEIGGTWLAASAQRTGANTDAKLLMLTHAFENLGATRVEFKTHSKNEKSRRAIERIGGVFEGLHRKHMLHQDGSRRDSAWYSILDDEWPAVKARLEDMLNGKGVTTENAGPTA